MTPPDNPPPPPDFEVGAGTAVAVELVVVELPDVVDGVVVVELAVVAWKATTWVAEAASKRPSPTLGVGK
jgi:hypothetical protein